MHDVHTTLFIITKKWKQHNFSLTKLYHTHTIEYYSAIKINEILIHAIAWKNL
jgi:hypothetical protein